jgi:NAD-dependent dihydropyrimidine dehydrogenase PreA subunit
MGADSEFPTGPRDNPTFDQEKARRAARDPKRPGQRCRAKTATFAPRVNRNRCEGKSDCVAVCPYGVFEVRRISEADYRALSFLGRLKSRAHGGLTAYTPRADACQACGLCVVACPERAITLAPRSE